MTPAQEAAFEKKADQHFKSHKPCPLGRNNWCWELRNDPESNKNWRDNFDNVFPDAPGAGI